MAIDLVSRNHVRCYWIPSLFECVDVWWPLLVVFTVYVFLCVFNHIDTTYVCFPVLTNFF